MTKFKLGLAVAAISVAGFACGGNNTTSNSMTNNTSTNNNNSSTNNTSMNNTSTNNTATNNSSTNNTSTNNNTPIPEPPGCDDANPPARCSEDPSTFEWASSSLVDDFFIEGTEDEPVCCFDYTDDGDIDNSLGVNLAAFGFLADINDTVATSIEDGSLALVLEHDGLDALDNDDDFVVNFYIAEHDYADLGVTACTMDTECDTGFCDTDASLCGLALDGAGANPVLLAPESFDEGAQPQAYLPDASVTGGAAQAGPGSVKIEIELFDSPLQLTISLARIEGDIDAANSNLADDTGVAITSGKLGGVVKIEDIFVAVNEFSESSCECLGLGTEDLVNVETGMCSDSADAQACEDAGESTCAEVAGACNLFGAVGLFADVDLDGDGLADSVSIGASLTAVGATINGVGQ